MDPIRKASRLLFSTVVVVQFAVSAALADQPREPEPPAVPFFKIVPGRDSRGGDREIQAFAADLIGRQAKEDRSVPDGRVRHFSWIKMPIAGWRGEVLDQSVVPTGLRVRMRVYPNLGGGCCAVGQHTDETYLIKDGVARLVTIEYSDPNVPRIITFN
jgi:hypothetical protein